MKEKESGLLDTSSAKAKELQSTDQPLAGSVKRLGLDSESTEEKAQMDREVLAKICLLPALYKAQRGCAGLYKNSTLGMMCMS